MTASETSAQMAAGSAINTISVVIPAFNEAARIGDSIRKIEQFLSGFPYRSELIVVDDGSRDTTFQVLCSFRFPGFRLIHNRTNHGKGYSVRQGVLAATGDYVLFSDADLSAPIEELQKLLNVAISESADVVVGSRSLDRSFIEKHQSRFREAGGIFFNWMVRLVLGLNLHDTQCGFKLFKRQSTSAIFQKQTTDGFGFDPEILFLAKQRGLKIREVSVRWSHAEGSKVRFTRDATRMFTDLVRIRWNYLMGRYS
jgi:glycosyltransferase involved in cell wall biosynthesis